MMSVDQLMAIPTINAPHECAVRRAEPSEGYCGENEQQDASTNIPLDGVEPEECA